IVPLFGGAILVTTPADLVDASDFRQVPDTQEVFMYPDSEISIIVEILQSVEPAGGIEAVRYHFSALAHDNDAKHTDILHTRKIERDSKPPVFVLHGEQHIQKFNAAELDRVCILMALYRIEEKKADLVVTFNVPTEAAGG
ncbi:Mog1p/PsbP-like protein, partial [Amanita rubescens]